jgi:hypothetical protein
MNTRALYKLGYGVYIVTSKRGDRFNGQIANTVFQVASEAPTIAVSINRTTSLTISSNKAESFPPLFSARRRPSPLSVALALNWAGTRASLRGSTIGEVMADPVYLVGQL